MSTTTTTVATRDRNAPATARRAVVWSSLAALAADLAIMTILAEIIPPLAVFAALTLGAVGATRRRERAGVVVLALLALFANVGGLPFLLADLASPSDPVAFLWAVVSGGGRVVAIIAAVMALTGRDVPPRRLATASLAVLGAAVIGSVVARSTVSSDIAQAGDIEIIAEDVRFPEHIAVPAGGAVLVDNRDPVRHTFAIEGTDLDVLVAPGVQRRIPIDVAPGTYTFICTVPGHESMTGTLEVG